MCMKIWEAQKDQTSKRPANNAIKANGPSYIQLYWGIKRSASGSSHAKGYWYYTKKEQIDEVMNQNLRGQSMGGDGSQQLGVDQ
jgi:hypothetical protein